jgi:hypothetical protein
MRLPGLRSEIFRDGKEKLLSSLRTAWSFDRREPPDRATESKLKNDEGFFNGQTSTASPV